MGNLNGSISWIQYFMGIAKISALRSKDPVTKVGACIVNESNHVVALGYNGMPTGCDDELMPWGKGDSNILQTKHPYVCHAELNAILNSGGRKLSNAVLFVTLFPCCECAKAIIQVGIKKVIFDEIKNENKVSILAAKKMFKITGVQLQKYSEINFNKTVIKIEV